MYKTKLNKIGNLIENIKNDISMPIISDFLVWFYEKINIHFNKKEINKFPKHGEIWISKLGINIGSEQNGEVLSNFTRPVLILKSFSNKNDNIIILPLTKNKKPDYISYILKNTDYNFLKYETSYILLDQIRTISKQRLLGNPIGSIGNIDFLKIQEKGKKLLFENYDKKEKT